MPAVKLEQFGGMLPAWDNHLLPTGQAAQSVNGYLFSGALQGWRQPKLLRALQNSAARYVYRIPTVTETQATAYLVFVTQPNNGDSIVLGEDTYTYQNALVNPYDILIGATPAATATNTLAAFTQDNKTNANAGLLYGQNTVFNPDILIYASGVVPAANLPAPSVGTVNIGGTNYYYVQVGAPDFGAAFNNIGVSENTGRGRLLWNSDLLALADGTITFVGGTNPSFTNNITGASTWLEFLDQDTNVLKSQVADDQFDRFYFASPSQEPQYNTRARIIAGKPAWLLGVPPPGCAPLVTVTGGGDTLQLGNLNTNNTTVWGSANYCFLIQITPTGATQLQDIQFGAQQAFPAALFAAVVYEDNNGVPGALLNSGTTVQGVVTPTNESVFVNPSSLLAQTPYWIGIIFDTQIAFSDSGSGAINNVTAVIFANTFSNGPPSTAPAVSGSVGIQLFADCLTSDVVESRAYIYTWVSAYGEEGPPSPPTLTNGWSNGTWTVGLWVPPADDLGVLRNLAVLRLYRTVTATGGATVYYWVADVSLGSTDLDAIKVVNDSPIVPASFTGGVQSSMATGINPPSATYVDTNPDSLVALNVQMPSTNFFPPPGNLQGLVSLPNGMMAGWIGNAVWFCEPYFAHAWPPGYVLTTDFPIVGLGVGSGTIVVCTNARPYVINGISPANMTMQKCSKPEPCNSRASILDGDAAVSYMSPNGLIQVTPSGQVTNTTELWITRERWQALTPSAYSRAIYLASCYFCFGTTSPLGVVPSDNTQAQSGFTIELDQDNASFTIWPQPGGHRLGFNQLLAPNGFNVDNVLNDPWTGIGLLIQNQSIYYYDFTDQAPTMQPYAWASKVYQQNTKKNYEAIKVFFSQPAGPTGPALNNIPVPFGSTLPTGTTGFTGGLTGPNQNIASDISWNTLQPNQLGIIKTFADYDKTGVPVLVDCREITESGHILRIISGFKAEQWAWQIIARVKISNVQIATSAKELANV